MLRLLEVPLQAEGFKLPNSVSSAKSSKLTPSEKPVRCLVTRNATHARSRSFSLLRSVTTVNHESNSVVWKDSPWPWPDGELLSQSNSAAGPGSPAMQRELVEQSDAACQALTRGQFAAAAVQFRALLRIGLANQDASLAEVACHNLAAVFRQSRQLETAECWQQQSVAWRLRQVESSRSPRDDTLGRLACDLTGRGCDAFLKHDWDLAESFWRRSLAIEEWLGSWEGQAADWGNLGLLAAARGDLRGGIRCLRKSLRLHRLMLDEGQVGIDLLNLAELRRLMGDVLPAIRLVHLAVRCFDRAQAGPLRQQAETRLRELRRIEALSRLDPRVN